MTRDLSVIAREIHNACHGRPWYYAARPYVEAMATLHSVTDRYGYDSADSIIRYALSNLSSWRGSQARATKAELRAML